MAAARFLKSLPIIPKHRSVRLAAIVLTAVLSANAAHADPILWHKDLQTAAREAAVRGRPIMAVVGARWCGYCRKMQAETFPNPAVAAHVKDQFVPLLIDADEQPALVQKLNVASFPSVLVISPEQKIIGRFTGFQLANQLDKSLASFHRAQTKRAEAKAAETKEPFHRRAWAAIRASRPRTTLEAAEAFSTGR